MNKQPGMTVREWCLLVVLSILWGCSFFFSKVAVQSLPPLTLVLTRFTLASMALGFYVRARRLSIPRSIPAWAAFAGMGVLNNLVPASLIAWGQTIIPSGLASIFIATTPLFSIVVAHCFTSDERMTPNRVFGIAVGVAGVAALAGADVTRGSPRPILAMTGCLVAALSYGFANVFGRRFSRLGIAPPVGAFGQITATAMIALPLALVFENPGALVRSEPPVWASILGLALASTALAYVIFFRILASAGATNVSLVTLLIPVSAILLGTLVLGEHLSSIQAAGLGLIGLGLVAMDGRVWSAARQASAAFRAG